MPARVLLDDPTILIIGLCPDVGELLEVIVLALDRVLVDEPFRRDGRLVRADRQHTEGHCVVDQHVVPDRRIVVEHERADALGGDLIGKVSPHGSLTRQRIALDSRQKRCSRRPELAGRVDAKASRKPGRFQPRPVLQHLGVFLGALDSGRARRFRESLAELGMVRLAMVALAIVLPDKLPVALARQSWSRARPSLRQGDAARNKAPSSCGRT